MENITDLKKLERILSHYYEGYINLESRTYTVKKKIIYIDEIKKIIKITTKHGMFFYITDTQPYSVIYPLTIHFHFSVFAKTSKKSYFKKLFNQIFKKRGK